DRLSVHQIRRVHLDQCSVKSFHSWRRCQSTFSQAFPKVSNPDCPYDSPTNHSSFDTLPRAPVIHHVQVVESADIVRVCRPPDSSPYVHLTIYRVAVAAPSVPIFPIATHICPFLLTISNHGVGRKSRTTYNLFFRIESITPAPAHA